MAEEYIMSSKACVYVLGGSTSSTAALYDFDGVYFLDGGFADKKAGFVAHVRDISAVLLSAPAERNLGTVAALLEKKDKPVPVLLNSKPLKSAKPGSSGEQVIAIQQANSLLLNDGALLFTPQYPARIIYQSASKGILSLYIIAGDAKDGEAITKALASGNEAEVEKAAAEHGTIGVLLWRPAEADKPVVRVLISGTSGTLRIQQALDKAAKSLPFLNAPVVKSKDALTAIPAPSLPKPTAKPVAKPAARPATSSTATARAPTRSGPATSATTARGAPAKPAARAPPTTARPLTARTPAASTRPAASKPAAPSARSAAPAAKPRAPLSNGRPSEPSVQKKTVGKVAAAPAASSAAKKPAAPAAQKTATPAVAPASVPAPVPVPVPVPVVEEPAAQQEAPPAAPAPTPQVVVDDTEPLSSNSDLDIVVIPPTPEPPRGTDEKAEEAKNEEPIVDNVEPEIPQPIDAFKKPDDDEVVEKPPAPAPVVDDLIGDVKPSAPAVPEDHVIITNEDPALPDVAVPFVPYVGGGADELIKLDDDKEKIAPGFEEPLIPQAPREDGTLAECSEEVSKLVEISMDTDKAENSEVVQPIGEVTQLAQDLNHIHLDDATNDYVRKLSNQMIADATLPFTSALASSIVENTHDDLEKAESKVENAHNHNGNIDNEKHNLMQSRSSVIDGANGAPVEYEKTDPAIDDILAACAKESEKVDEQIAHDPVLHMPALPGKTVSKEAKFARPYYFDVVTVPHNEKLETTLGADGLQEFVGKVRSRNFVLPSKEISGEQLEGILNGKQQWADNINHSTIIPTHSSPALLHFRQQCEQRLVDVHLSVALPVEKQITTVTSDNVATDYELAKINLSSL